MHPGDLARGCSDLEMTWLLCCAGTATASSAYIRYDGVCWTAWVSPSLVIHRVFATTVQHPVSRLYCAEFLRTPYLDPFSSYAADVFQLVEGSGLTAHVYANDLQICDYTDPQHSAELRTRLAEVIN